MKIYTVMEKDSNTLRKRTFIKYKDAIDWTIYKHARIIWTSQVGDELIIYTEGTL